MNSAVRELARLRRKLTLLVDQANENEAILHRSQQRELSLLSAANLTSLFERMSRGLADSFSLEHVTVVVADPQHEIRHLLIQAGEVRDVDPAVIFVDSLSGLTPHYDVMTQPWTGRYSRSNHALVFPGPVSPGSVALIPLIHDGRLQGSINLASDDASRFTNTHATDFLAHLGVIASVALENTVNRARLTRSGFTDVLTGWHNRRSLQQRMQQELSRAAREEQQLACLMLDLDHFKNINDVHGHLAGDAVLSEVAHRIEEQIRVSDIAARFGGEEFVILLPNSDLAVAMVIAERIRLAVADPPIELAGGVALTVTVSIGVACIQPKLGTRDLKTVADGLIAKADVALYQSKGDGRNRVSAG